MRRSANARLSAAATLQAVRDSLRGDPAVTSVSLDGHAIAVMWQGTDAPEYFGLLEGREARPATAEQRAADRWQTLLNYQKALNRGSLVFFSRKVKSVYPPRGGTRIDAAILALRRGGSLSPEEQSAYDLVVPGVREEIIQPVSLQSAQ